MKDESFSLVLDSQLLSGGLAQLARAPALQAGGQRFESVILHEFKIVHWHIVQTKQRVERKKTLVYLPLPFCKEKS